MTGFALYRMPYARQHTLLMGEVCEVPSVAALSEQCGFVVAPFAPSPRQPIVVIRADSMDGALTMPGLSAMTSHVGDDGRSSYHADFQHFHKRLRSGEFQKLVLSRSLLTGRHDDATPQQLFLRACEAYPRMFVALVYTPQSGLWLMATPETLLAGEHGEWQTMALAGTMPFTGDMRWSDKNIQEQRYVATYIIRQLEPFADRCREDGPRTVRAGHLGHLRSDFRFTMTDATRVGELLQALHPTPAVCGLPKDEAFRFILANEHHQRSYYSGFMGPLLLSGQTHLFVTLRCMQFFSDGYRLYAGGGLLTDSDEQQEWDETEAKMDTMRNLLKTE